MGYKYFMNNPVGARVGDCAVRAISKALGISWEDAYTECLRAEWAEVISPQKASAQFILQKGNNIMNDKTLENFKKLPADKQDKLIALIEKFLSDYQPVFFAHH